jgi:hypothetical protein
MIRAEMMPPSWRLGPASFQLSKAYVNIVLLDFTESIGLYYSIMEVIIIL